MSDSSYTSIATSPCQPFVCDFPRQLCQRRAENFRDVAANECRNIPEPVRALFFSEISFFSVSLFAKSSHFQRLSQDCVNMSQCFKCLDSQLVAHCNISNSFMVALSHSRIPKPYSFPSISYVLSLSSLSNFFLSFVPLNLVLLPFSFSLFSLSDYPYISTFDLWPSF